MSGMKMTRRNFIASASGTIGTLSLTGILLNSLKKPAAGGNSGRSAGRKTIGLALGSGGAAGFAHIVMLEAFDELGIRPDRVAGSSAGAMIGALYCDGRSASGIKELMESMFPFNLNNWRENLNSGRWRTLPSMLTLPLGEIELFEADKTLGFLKQEIKADKFEELKTPLEIVAADYWSRSQRVFASGEIHRPLLGSMALPGLVRPVEYRGELLVDGGMVNPVPFDILQAKTDYVIAVNVQGETSPESDRTPSFFDSLFNTFRVMQTSILREKLKQGEPDLYLVPDISDVRVLEFHRAADIYKRSQPEKDRLKRTLESLIDS